MVTIYFSLKDKSDAQSIPYSFTPVRTWQVTEASSLWLHVLPPSSLQSVSRSSIPVQRTLLKTIGRL